jgi:hypothetical protein
VIAQTPEALIALRVVGGLVALGLLVWTFRRFSNRDISRLSLIIVAALAVGGVLISITPGLFDPLFNLFNFREGGGQRLIGLLVLGNIVFFVLLFRAMTLADTATMSIRHLVEALAVEAFDWSQQSMLPSGERVVVIMPAHNEAENVEAVIQAIPEKIEGYPVVPVVIDDASEDDTVNVAKKAGALVAHLPIRRGGGLALRVGYEIAKGLDALVCVSMDADGQHVPEEMTTLVGPILDGSADLVNGSRVLGEFQRESIIRHIGVHFFSRLVTVLVGSRITDVSNGYRAVRIDILKQLRLDQDQFWASELLIEGMRHRLRIQEVPITVRARAGGVSKKPKTMKYAWHFTKAIVKTWLR